MMEQAESHTVWDLKAAGRVLMITGTGPFRGPTVVSDQKSAHTIHKRCAVLSETDPHTSGDVIDNELAIHNVLPEDAFPAIGTTGAAAPNPKARKEAA